MTAYFDNYAAMFKRDGKKYALISIMFALFYIAGVLTTSSALKKTEKGKQAQLLLRYVPVLDRVIKSGNVFATTLLIFTLNFFAGTILFVVVTGVVFPPLSAVLMALRSFMWGGSLGLDDLILVILEGAAYLLVTIPAYRLFLSIVNPKLSCWKNASRKEAVSLSIRELRMIIPFSAIILLFSAFIESLMIIKFT